MSVDKLLYEYNLNKEDIYAALAYATKRIGEEARRLHGRQPNLLHQITAKRGHQLLLVVKMG